MAARTHFKTEHLSNPRDVYLTIESSPTPLATESTPLLGGSTKSSKRAYSDSGYSSSNSSVIKKPFSVNHHSKKYFSFRLLAIGILLVCGISIASYLLALESRLPTVGFALDFVNHEVWSKFPISLGNRLNNSNVLHVLILQTGGNDCNEMENCITLLQEMQENERLKKNSEIPYNFLIGGDGQTYEVRGWKHESGFNFLPSESSIVIGFIGDYTNKSPSQEQLKSALSLIRESEYKRKLNDTFQIYGVRNLTISHRDGEALFNHVSKWNQFDALLKVL